MSLWSTIDGIMNAFFRLGGPTGPGLNANGAVIEVKNAANNAYANLRAASPSVDADVATKAYVDELAYPYICSAQFNGGTTLPSNTTTEKWIVVTTAGTGSAASAVLGAILWDDGSNTGTVAVIAPALGNQIVPTTAFAGGTITLSANNQYIWNGSTWANLSPSVSGVLSAIDFAIGTSASQSSTTSIPANAVVYKTIVNIAVAYSAGATISIGQSGTTALLQGTSGNSPVNVGQYETMNRVAWGSSALAVLATVGGSPSAGSGTVTVFYSQPNS